MSKRTFFLMLSLLILAIGTTRVWSQSASDEGALKKLETESAKHYGTSEADITFEKSISASHLVTVDPLGHLADQTPAEYEKMQQATGKSNPDVKMSAEISDIKVRISGDTAIVTYSGTYTATGYKDSRYNVPAAKFVAVDTWQKQSGKWKLLAGTAVSTEAIPSDVYTLPPPGM